MQQIQMVDLKAQYQEIGDEINREIAEVLETTRFIGGPKVEALGKALEAYLDVAHVIPCANGTDALQIAMMALELKPGDEVIVPAFTYVATAEVIALLGLTPVMVDVDQHTFNLDLARVEAVITPKTKAIVPVHLFGQSVDMQPLMALAQKHGLYIIEDNAQAIGATYKNTDGTTQKTGTIGHIGCTSFFPSKNLGCYGDGGAMMTNDPVLAAKMRMIANHGQSKMYYHDVIGVNSRLDAMQAVILNIKLKHLDRYNASRQKAAAFYNRAFADMPQLVTPITAVYTNHVFHQYTLRLIDTDRDAFRAHLEAHGIPSMIYYPVPLYSQPAYQNARHQSASFPVTEMLCREVVSLPMHSELTEATLRYITETARNFWGNA
jgi:UDP-2-acetamido-2-deoxy-ribo-hexuluronate aminotransferase